MFSFRFISFAFCSFILLLTPISARPSSLFIPVGSSTAGTDLCHRHLLYGFFRSFIFIIIFIHNARPTHRDLPNYHVPDSYHFSYVRPRGLLIRFTAHGHLNFFFFIEQHKVCILDGRSGSSFRFIVFNYETSRLRQIEKIIF